MVKIKPGAFNTVDFKLVPVVTDLEEVMVTPGRILLTLFCVISLKIRDETTRPRRTLIIVPLIPKWNWTWPI